MENNYISPGGLLPKLAYGPGPVMSGWQYRQQMEDYEKLMGLQKKLSELGVEKSQSEMDEYKLNEPVRAATRLGSIATQGAKQRTAIPRAEADLRQVTLGNEKTAGMNPLEIEAKRISNRGEENRVQTEISGRNRSEALARLRELQLKLSQSINPDSAIVQHFASQGKDVNSKEVQTMIQMNKQDPGLTKTIAAVEQQLTRTSEHMGTMEREREATSRSKASDEARLEGARISARATETSSRNTLQGVRDTLAAGKFGDADKTMTRLTMQLYGGKDESGKPLSEEDKTTIKNQLSSLKSVMLAQLMGKWTTMMAPIAAGMATNPDAAASLKQLEDDTLSKYQSILGISPSTPPKSEIKVGETIKFQGKDFKVIKLDKDGDPIINLNGREQALKR